MKLVARCVTALALLAFAAPALPCGDKPMKTTTASTEKAAKETVAKASTKKNVAPTKAPAEAKPAATD